MLVYRNRETDRGWLTCVSEGVGEAEEIHSIEGQQMIQELLSLIFTPQESVALVQSPARSAVTGTSVNPLGFMQIPPSLPHPPNRHLGPFLQAKPAATGILTELIQRNSCLLPWKIRLWSVCLCHTASSMLLVVLLLLSQNTEPEPPTSTKGSGKIGAWSEIQTHNNLVLSWAS